MIWSVERDEEARDDLAQAPVLPIGEGGRVQSGFDRAPLLRRIRIDRNIDAGVGWRLAVFYVASPSAICVDAEADLAALSQGDEGGRIDGRERHIRLGKELLEWTDGDQRNK